MDTNLKLLNKASEPQTPKKEIGALGPTNTVATEIIDLDLYEVEDVNAFPKNFIVIDDASSQGLEERVSAEANVSSKTMKAQESDDTKPNSRKKPSKPSVNNKTSARRRRARNRRLKLLLSKGYTKEEAAILERNPREMANAALDKLSVRTETGLEKPSKKLSGAGIKRKKHYLHKGYSQVEAKRLAYYPISVKPEEILERQGRLHETTITRSVRSHSNKSDTNWFFERQYSDEDEKWPEDEIEIDNRSVDNNWETDEPAEKLERPCSPSSVESENSDKDSLSDAGRKRMRYFLANGYNCEEAVRLARNPMIAAKKRKQDKLLSGKQNTEYIRTPHKSERAMSNNSNDELIDTKVFVLPFDYPNTIWSSEQLTIVRNAILEAIRDQCRSHTKPTFSGCTFRPGYLILTCVDVSTVNWVGSVVPHLKPWEDAELKVVGENLKPKTLICTALVPELDSMSSESILALIEGQNEGVRATDWIIMNRMVRGPVIELTMAIDPVSQKVLADRGHNINYGFSQVYIKQKNKGSSNGGKEDYRKSTNDAKFLNSSRNLERNDTFHGNDDYEKSSFDKYTTSVSQNYNDEQSTNQYKSEWSWSSEVKPPYAFSEPHAFNNCQNQQLFNEDNNCGFTRRIKPSPYTSDEEPKPKTVAEHTITAYQGNSQSNYSEFVPSTDAIFTRRQPSNCQITNNNSDDLQRYAHRNMNEQQQYQQQHWPQYMADDKPIVNAQQQQQQQYQIQNYANNQDNFTNFATMLFGNANNMNHSFNLSPFGMASGTGFDISKLLNQNECVQKFELPTAENSAVLPRKRRRTRGSRGSKGRGKKKKAFQELCEY